MQKQSKKTPPVVPPPDPENVWSVEVSTRALSGGVLGDDSTDVSPVLALGDALARWEDAMLKRDYHAAAEAAFDAAWLARECRLRRGDEGNGMLQVGLKFTPSD